MNLPSRPACFRQYGRITCDCDSLRKSERNACAASRYFWDAADFVAGMANNAERKSYMNLMGSLRGPFAVQQLRAAALELMAERA